jgi:hypothetical protein
VHEKDPTGGTKKGHPHRHSDVDSRVPREGTRSHGSRRASPTTDERRLPCLSDVLTYIPSVRPPVKDFTALPWYYFLHLLRSPPPNCPPPHQNYLDNNTPRLLTMSQNVMDGRIVFPFFLPWNTNGVLWCGVRGDCVILLPKKCKQQATTSAPQYINKEEK